MQRSAKFISRYNWVVEGDWGGEDLRKTLFKLKWENDVHIYRAKRRLIDRPPAKRAPTSSNPLRVPVLSVPTWIQYSLRKTPALRTGQSIVPLSFTRDFQNSSATPPWSCLVPHSQMRKTPTFFLSIARDRKPRRQFVFA